MQRKGAYDRVSKIEDIRKGLKIKKNEINGLEKVIPVRWVKCACEVIVPKN